MNDVAIVMYHYVRDIRGSRRPNIKGLELEGFRRQLDHLERTRAIVPAQALIDAVRGGAPLPPEACLLTFDDGYRDHVDHVLPELLRRGLTGAFFPPATPVADRVPLDVNRIHFILAEGPDDNTLLRDLEECCRAHGVGAAELETHRAAYAKPGRYDTAEVVYVKRLLQHALPEAVRAAVVGDLFARYVGLSPEAFADELYITADEARALTDAGMYVGSHGDRHVWLDRESRAGQERDIDASLAFLAAIGAPTDGWIMCYPYGGYDADTLDILKRRNCAIGLTTRVGAADLGRDDPLELPRLNTNDFPQ